MKNIYKWKLYSNNLAETVINVPLGSKLLSIDLQGDDYNAWFEIDIDENRTANVVLRCVYTGHNFENRDWIHVKTIVEDPSFVIHFYIKKEFDNFLKDEDFSL